MKCKCECGNEAVWVYSPSREPDPYYCEDCVPRGCSCNLNYTKLNFSFDEDSGYTEDPPTDNSNWKWVAKDRVWCYVDEQNREFPCCEYYYSAEGFETN